MHWFLKQYLNFSRRERRSLLWVLIILNALLFYRIYLSNKPPARLSLSEQQQHKIDSFVNSFQKLPEVGESVYVRNIQKEDTVKKAPVYVNFNPNDINRQDLRAMGLDEFVINNILAYRRAGGYFQKPEDLGKIYGMEKDVYRSLLPYIDLPEKKDSEKDIKDFDSLGSEKVAVELNSAVFKDLMKIEGLPPQLAGRILKYRELLGGFYYREQLSEVYGLNDSILKEIMPCIRIDSMLIRRISLRDVSFSELLRHPYMEKSDVQNFFRIKDFYGDSIRKEHLIENRIFADSTLRRISPYLSDN